MRQRDIDSEKEAVPFTARLIAHHRAKESVRESPLIVDSFARRLAGDMSEYFKKHLERSGDYSIVRAYFIDNNLLSPWCMKHSKSQIVLLGAGLDTRAYRFTPLRDGTHKVFEVDYSTIIEYKETILADETPLCEVVRIRADLSDSDWAEGLFRSGYSPDVSTFWVLEGLVYYLEKEIARGVLEQIAKMSTGSSEVFADLCVPVLAEVQFGPFMVHFKWGLAINDVPEFFSSTGWSVECWYADEYDQGRDVGQKGLIFVHGALDKD